MEEVWVTSVVPTTKPPMVNSNSYKRKEDSMQMYKGILVRVFSTSSGLGVLVYICACFFILAIGGVLMVVSMWFL